MNIDVHGHYTTAPPALSAWRNRQIAAFEKDGSRIDTAEMVITDDEIRESIEKGQIPLQDERDTDLTLFSPTAGGMGHHFGDERTSIEWTTMVNDLIVRVCELFPQRFVGVAQIPQSPGVSPANSVAEVRRCVEELDFVGVNINPDPTDGFWTDLSMADHAYYPLYEVLCELDVPLMAHVSTTCNPLYHITSSHYLNGDTTAFMQLAMSDVFKDFPSLRVIVPHGGGAIPYHWGRIQGILLDQKKPWLEEIVLGNVYFDTCVYWPLGMKLLLDTVPADNILYASEMIGAVRGRNPRDGHYFDDTKYILDQITTIPDEDRKKIYGGNAVRVYPRLERVIPKRGLSLD